MFILLFQRDLIFNKCKTIISFLKSVKKRIPLPFKKTRVFGKLHKEIIKKSKPFKK